MLTPLVLLVKFSFYLFIKTLSPNSFPTISSPNPVLSGALLSPLLKKPVTTNRVNSLLVSREVSVLSFNKLRELNIYLKIRGDKHNIKIFQEK